MGLLGSSLLVDSLQLSCASLPEVAMSNMFPNDHNQNEQAHNLHTQASEDECETREQKVSGDSLPVPGSLAPPCGEIETSSFTPYRTLEGFGNSAKGGCAESNSGVLKCRQDATYLKWRASSSLEAASECQEHDHVWKEEEAFFKPAIRQDSYELRLLARLEQSEHALETDSVGSCLGAHSSDERSGQEAWKLSAPWDASSSHHHFAAPLTCAATDKSGSFRARMRSLSDRALKLPGSFKRKKEMVPIPTEPGSLRSRRRCRFTSKR